MGDNDATHQRTQDIVDDSEDHWRPCRKLTLIGWTECVHYIEYDLI